MNTTRRGFLSFLGLAVAAPVLAKLPAAPPRPELPAANETWEVGDIFTIDGFYAINPLTRRVAEHRGVKQLKQFVVTGPNTFFPAPIMRGPYANCWMDGTTQTMPKRKLGYANRGR